MLAKVLILFLLSALCKHSIEFGCTTCTVLSANFCCKFKSICCAYTTTSSEGILGAGALTPGICPTPIPRIPPQGLLARVCTSDSECPYGFKCCPIIQSGTGVSYQICTVPSSNATLATRSGFCPSPVPLIPPQGITARLCNGDEDCTTDLRCCSIQQNSTGRFFQVCTVPVLVPLVTTPSTPRPSTTPAGVLIEA